MHTSEISESHLVCLFFSDNLDLSVDCGTSIITLEVNLCTAQWAGFNSTDLALNGNHNNTDCQGSIDTSVDPPVIRYQLPVNHSQDNPCRHSLQVRKCLVEELRLCWTMMKLTNWSWNWTLFWKLFGNIRVMLWFSLTFTVLVQIVDETPDPSGPFSSFLSIQSVIITGNIETPRSDQGLISYSTDLYYHFSCRYPLEYLINNTQIVAWVTAEIISLYHHLGKL